MELEIIEDSNTRKLFDYWLNSFRVNPSNNKKLRWCKNLANKYLRKFYSAAKRRDGNDIIRYMQLHYKYAIKAGEKPSIWLSSIWLSSTEYDFKICTAEMTINFSYDKH